MTDHVAEIARNFIGAINKRSPDLIAELMTEDHLFIDSLGTNFHGRESMREGWKSYFAMVPDYWIKHDFIMTSGDLVGIFGKAGGTLATDGKLLQRNKWEAPASWLAKVRNGKVAKWQVFCDNEPLRKLAA